MQVGALARRSARPTTGRAPTSSASSSSPGVPFRRVLERHGDQALDLLGRQARRLGLDLDQRRGELGEDVERRVAARPGCRRPSARRTGPRPAAAAAATAAISERIIGGAPSLADAELGAEQLGRAGGHHARARRRALVAARRRRRRNRRPRRGGARRRAAVARFVDPGAAEDVVAAPQPGARPGSASLDAQRHADADPLPGPEASDRDWRRCRRDRRRRCAASADGGAATGVAVTPGDARRGAERHDFGRRLPIDACRRRPRRAGPAARRCRSRTRSNSGAPAPTVCPGVAWSVRSSAACGASSAIAPDGADAARGQRQPIAGRLQRGVRDREIGLRFFGGALAAGAVARQLPRALGALGGHLLPARPPPPRARSASIRTSRSAGASGTSVNTDLPLARRARRPRRGRRPRPSVPANGAVTVSARRRPA